MSLRQLLAQAKTGGVVLGDPVGLEAYDDPNAPAFPLAPGTAQLLSAAASVSGHGFVLVGVNLAHRSGRSTDDEDLESEVVSDLRRSDTRAAWSVIDDEVDVYVERIQFEDKESAARVSWTRGGIVDFRGIDNPDPEFLQRVERLLADAVQNP